ncbi:MAG TPA: hypothetical protein VI216_11800 [Candidatus Acidoferrales bacterium]
MSEFYIGYLPKAPVGIRRRVLALVILLLVLCTACAFLFAKSQKTFANSLFEFGKERVFEGTIEEAPYPILSIKRPGASLSSAAYSHYLLVAAGKHGANAQVAKYVGKDVRLRGSLIYRDGQTMIELVNGSIAEVASAQRPPEAPSMLGEFTLTGEIVDSKCYLGVMNPGSGKVHRDCAVRCISGGIPPALATKDLDGTPSLLLLTDLQHKPLPKEVIIRLVGQPVRIRGQVLRLGSTMFLETESAWIAALR